MGKMKEIFDVSTGEVTVRRGDFILRALAIGSCIVIAAYDSRTKTAAMAHIMLPGSAPQRSLEKTKYAADAIKQMLNQMLKLGPNPEDIESCLIGAGNVLQKKDDTICEDNIKSVTTILAEKSIPVRASALGGTKRKSVFLDAQTGSISYAEGDNLEKVLWKPAMGHAVKQS